MTRTKGTFFQARYHRLAARRGKKRALIAIGHSMLIAVYYILSDKEDYRELGANYLLQRTLSKRKAYLTSELKKIGYHVELSSIQPAV